MPLFHIIVLALVQGLTEFLPISSSAHLIFPSALMGWEDQGLAFDVAVHVGTLIAVMVYFRRDLLALMTGWVRHCAGQGESPEARLAWYLILATIPVGVAGLLLNDLISQYLRSILVIAATTLIFGALLGLADKRGHRIKSMDQLGWREALFIGCAQAVALIPGTSRSGITITAALALGYDRVTASRFSFLLAIPVIVLSGGFKGVELLSMPEVAWREILLAVIISAITAYLCISAFLTFVNRIGMMPFVWYRMVLGLFLLIVYWVQS